MTTTCSESGKVHPQACDCGRESGGLNIIGGRHTAADPVYALGKIGYQFSSEAARDAIAQNMPEGESPYNPAQLVKHIDDHPYEAAGVVWTLETNSAPIYAIRPVGSFSGVVYKRLTAFISGQLQNKVRQVSIPGYTEGEALAMSGRLVPIMIPDVRGMMAWQTADGVSPNLLSRLFFELERSGADPGDRAMNFAAAYTCQTEKVFESATKASLSFKSIEVAESLACRPGSDCRDVKITFFNADKQDASPKKIYLITVDVSGVIPVTMGGMRSWDQY